ncbi:class III poly(R)-hydroxyalkanoic acid synthase subunit PhaC [Neptunomonas japonica]|uniref:Poly(3-hydroxyalkanoate) polymerase subunit PhaC n=1 Tax=Neptunomonas japonica JAMM 1380 TaxID=1441457 RepID=A0A7R6SWQ2_9GAMM|nr:class III poly(R)-hydroxyalkanoic acid synthase subunit PhaC [Neptunomonas japonica]BBB29957.1 polyhydroxyalkanoate synthase [Neptunomonas japonica JAMM 1380]
MKNLKLDPNKIQDELIDLEQKLQSSYETLKGISHIDVAQSQAVEIFAQDKLKLLYFSGNKAVETRCKTPLLITYALVNRWYMIDLEPKKSLLKTLNSLGLDVYVIDWGYPDPADRFNDLDDYINEYINNCVDQVCLHAQVKKTNLLGICQGGTLSLCYTAIYGDKISNLITMVTPVDFQTETNLLSLLARSVDVDLAVSTYGNIPGEMLNDSYNSLMPMRLGIQKNLGMPNHLHDAESALSFLRMEKWIYDSPDQAGEAFREFIKWFFQENRLIKNQLSIGEYPVRLANITQPVLNIFGSYDHLVPPDASIALRQYIGSKDYQEEEVKAGHIGVFVSGKSQAIVPKKINDWLLERD